MHKVANKVDRPQVINIHIFTDTLIHIFSFKNKYLFRYMYGLEGSERGKSYDVEKHHLMC